MKNKKLIKVLALSTLLILVALGTVWILFSQQIPTEKQELQIETSAEKTIPEGDLEIKNLLILDTTTPHSEPLNIKIGIYNNSDHRIQRLMLNVFINDELYQRYYINDGLNQNSNITYELNDLAFREDQLGFNQIKFEIVPLQEFIDSKPENNEKIISIEVFTY